MVFNTTSQMEPNRRKPRSVDQRPSYGGVALTGTPTPKDKRMGHGFQFKRQPMYTNKTDSRLTVSRGTTIDLLDITKLDMKTILGSKTALIDRLAAEHDASKKPTPQQEIKELLKTVEKMRR